MLVKVQFLVLVMLLIIQNSASANQLKCRHKIGGEHTVEICHCKVDDALRCDLMRAKEILNYVKEQDEAENIVNEMGELELIVDHLISVDAAKKHKRDVMNIIDALEECLSKDISDEMTITDFVIPFAKIGNYAHYYGHGRDDVIPNILVVYRNVEYLETKYFENFVTEGFRMERGGNNLLTMLRTTIYNIDKDSLPDCPKIILQHGPKSCEIRK